MMQPKFRYCYEVNCEPKLDNPYSLEGIAPIETRLDWYVYEANAFFELLRSQEAIADVARLMYHKDGIWH